MKRALAVVAILALLVALPATAVAAKKHRAAEVAPASITATVETDGVVATWTGGTFGWVHVQNDCVAGWVSSGDTGSFTFSPCPGSWVIDLTDSTGTTVLATTEVTE